MAQAKQSAKKFSEAGTKAKKKDWVVFIDTCILLDFYRSQGSRERLSTLNHLDGNHDKIVTTVQVEMEYMKNRARVLLEAARGIPSPGKGLTVPAFLDGSKPVRSLNSAQKRLQASTKKVRERTERLLENPSQNDPIYKVLRRLFKSQKDLHLTRRSRERRAIRARARRRFLMGYPPRKSGDSSMGDAINWEWIIHCATALTSANVVIVSRDTDYGHEHDGTAHINDWLREEFRDRVSRKREIVLTSRLTEAFELAGIRVSKREKEAEQEDEREREQVIEPSAKAFEVILSSLLKSWQRETESPLLTDWVPGAESNRQSSAATEAQLRVIRDLLEGRPQTTDAADDDEGGQDSNRDESDNEEKNSNGTDE